MFSAGVHGVDDKFDEVLLGVEEVCNLEVWLDLLSVLDWDFWLDVLCSEVKGLLVEGFFLFSST